MDVHRICVLTLYRLYRTVSLDPKDWQEGYAVIILLTCLEALLGVVNACLPALKPVVAQIRSLASGKGISRLLIFSKSSEPIQLYPTRTQSSKNYVSIDEENFPSSKPNRWADTLDNAMVNGGQGSTSHYETIAHGDTSRALKATKVHIRRDENIELTPPRKIKILRR